MEFVFGTFVGIVAIIFGLYWVLIDRPEAQEGSAVRKRLRGATKATLLRQAAIARGEERLSDVGAFDRLLSRGRSTFGPLQLLITQAGLNVTVGTILLSWFLPTEGRIREMTALSSNTGARSTNAVAQAGGDGD